MPAKILVVDEEPAIRRLLRNTLTRAGYEVVEAGDGRAALQVAAAEHPAAVLLDLGLPDRDGLGLLPLLKDLAVVIVVSARDAVEEKVAALDLGAEDFVTKPFDSEELLARLRVALRRSEAKGGGVVRAGEVTIDPAAHRVERAGAEVHLTRKEYEVLTLLADHAGRVVTHKLILQRVWGGHDPKVEYLRIVIRNLRQKLEAPHAVGSLIANEQGIGYRLIG